MDSNHPGRTARRANLTVALLILVPLVTGSLRLATVPPLWWDEGWTLTVARTWGETGHYGRLLEGAPIPPGLTAAPTVVLPIALTFRIFGVGAWQGRLPMVLWTALALWLLYRLSLLLYDRKTGLVAVALALIGPAAAAVHPLVVGRQVLGEMPAVCFLLAGYILLFTGLPRVAAGCVLGAGLMWGLAAVTKPQILPFLALSVGAVVTVAWRQKNWRALSGGIAAFVLALGLNLIWSWATGDQRSALGPEWNTEGLLGVTAVVPDWHVRLAALIYILWAGLPSVVALGYTARHDSAPEPQRLPRLAVFTLAASWLLWFAFLAASIMRYLFVPLFVCAIFVAALLRDITDNFDATVLRNMVLGLHPGRWRSLRRSQKWILIAAVPLACVWLLGLSITMETTDGSLFRLAQYLHTEVSPEALVETYDAEVLFVSDRRFHFPPDQVAVQLMHRRLYREPEPAIDYDPLAAGPEYLIVGPFIKHWELYPEELLARCFRIQASFGGYDLYRSSGTCSSEAQAGGIPGGRGRPQESSEVPWAVGRCGSRQAAPAGTGALEAAVAGRLAPAGLRLATHP